MGSLEFENQNQELYFKCEPSTMDQEGLAHNGGSLCHIINPTVIGVTWGGHSSRGLITPTGAEGFSFPFFLCSLTQKAEQGIFF